jgi:hypothetical protein
MKPKYEVHPLAAAFPALGGVELDELIEDIRRNGVREPIVLYEGKILDGRNRATAALIAGIDPPTVQFDPKTAGCSPEEFVISMNLVRRHLTSSQKSAIAHEFMERMKHKGAKHAPPPRRPAMDEWEDITAALHRGPPAQPAQPHRRQRAIVAEKFGVSEGLIDAARRVKAKSPELHEQVKAGKVSVQEALDKAERGTNEFQRALVKIERVIGPRAMKAFDKKAKEALAYANLTDEEMRKLWPLIESGETLQNALKYRESPLTPAHTIKDLIAAATIAGGTVRIGEFTIVVTQEKKIKKEPTKT